MSESFTRAQRVVPVFDGERLLATRELLGRTQSWVAEQAQLTPSAVSQAERGLSNPTASTVSRLARVLEVPVEAFARRQRTVTELRPQFRHLRRTPQREQKRAARLVEATDAVVTVLKRRVRLPDPFDFEHPVDPRSSIEEVAPVIEEAAQLARQSLGLGTMDPVNQSDGGLVTLLEDNGIVLVRDPDTDKNIDAYSAVVNDQPIVVLDGAETDWDRDNFNVAHELGHLVMHRNSEQRPGTRTAEAQAHRFAGALLAPRAAILDEIPSDLEWGKYLQLKLRWGLSMAALVHRAHDLGVMSDSLYERAMKQRSAYGWRRVEPGRDTWPLVQPSLLAEAAATGDLSDEEIAKSAGIPVAVATRILGPGPRPQVRAIR